MGAVKQELPKLILHMHKASQIHSVHLALKPGLVRHRFSSPWAAWTKDTVYLIPESKPFHRGWKRGLVVTTLNIFCKLSLVNLQLTYFYVHISLSQTQDCFLLIILTHREPPTPNTCPAAGLDTSNKKGFPSGAGCDWGLCPMAGAEAALLLGSWNYPCPQEEKGRWEELCWPFLTIDATIKLLACFLGKALHCTALHAGTMELCRCSCSLHPPWHLLWELCRQAHIFPSDLRHF